MPIQQRNDGMVQLLGADFQKRYEPNFAFAQAIGMLQMFPGVVGIWPGSVTDGAGQMIDVSGNGNHLTNNNTATFNNSGTDLIPYVECLAASTQYFSHSDGAPFDILGTEGYIGNLNGLTLGGWFWDNSGASNAGLISKWGTTGASGGYLLYRIGGTNVQLALENSLGTLETQNGSGFTSSAWHYVVGRWTHNSLKGVFVDGTKTETASSLTNLRNNAIPFQIGAWTASSRYMNGRISLAFLCTSAVPDVFIETFYQQSRALFGV